MQQLLLFLGLTGYPGNGWATRDQLYILMQMGLLLPGTELMLTIC